MRRQDNVEIGLLNCYNKRGAIYEAIEQLEEANWLLGVNEYNPNIVELCNTDNEVELFTNKRAAIIAKKDVWKRIWNPIDCEAITVRGCISNRDILVTCVYLSPNLSGAEFRRIINGIHDFLYEYKRSLKILIGDVNCEAAMWSNNGECWKGKLLVEKLLHLKMMSVFDPTRTIPTRNNQNGGKWIDIATASTKLGQIIRNRRIIDITNSDHRMLSFKISNTAVVTTRKINEEKLREMSLNIQLDFLETKFNTIDVEDQCNELMNLMRKMGEECSEVKMLRRCHITRQKLLHIRKLNNIKKKYMKTAKNNEVRQRIKEIIRNNIKLHYKQYEIGNHRRYKNRMKLMLKENRIWDIIKKTMGNKRLIKINDCINETHSKEKYERCIETLSKDYSATECRKPTNKELKRSINANIDNVTLTKLVMQAMRKPCMYEKYVNNKLLKIVYEQHSSVINKWLIGMIETCYTPQAIKTGRTVFIQKADRNKARPLTILNPIYRLVDKITLHLINKNIEKNEKLKHQFSYLKDKSIKDAIIEIIRIVKSDDDNIIMITADIESAFDNLNIGAIIDGLREINTPVNLTKHIIQHIEKIDMFIVKDATRSWKLCTKGVPQGGFTSPILFIIGTIDIGKTKTNSFIPIQYADDLLIIIKGNNANINQLANCNAKAWNKLKKTLTDKDLKLNEKKTRVIIGQRSRPTTSTNTLTIGEDTFIQSNSIEFLGITIETTEQKHKKLMKIRDKTKQKIEQLRKQLAPTAAKLQCIPIIAVRTMLASYLTGIINYHYGCTQLWNKDVGKTESEIKEAIGKIVKMCLKLRKNLDHQTAYSILYPTDLFEKIRQENLIALTRSDKNTVKRELIEHLLREDNIDNYESIYDWPIYLPKYHRKIAITSDEDATELTTAFIRYNRKIMKTRNMINIWTMNTATICHETYNFWCNNMSYLNPLMSGLCIFILKYEGIIAENNEIKIEADKGVTRAILNPKTKTMLTDTCLMRGLSLTLLERKEIPRMEHRPTSRNILIRHSKQGFALNKYTKIANELEQCTNLARKILITNGEKIINNSKFCRIDLWALTLIAGCWRSRDNLIENCENCGQRINTAHLLFKCQGMEDEWSKRYKKLSEIDDFVEISLHEVREIGNRIKNSIETYISSENNNQCI